MTSFFQIVNCGGDYDDPCWSRYSNCLKKTKMERTDCYGCNPKPEKEILGCSNCRKVIRVTDDGKHAKINDHLALGYSRDSKGGRWECISPYLTDNHTCPYCFERDIPSKPITSSSSKSLSTQKDSSKLKESGKKGWWSSKKDKGWW